MSLKNKIIVDKRKVDSIEIIKFVNKQIAESKNNEQFFELTVKEKRSQRSIQANRFLHGPLIDAFVRHTGYQDREYLKFKLKDKFLRTYVGKKESVSIQKSLDLVYALKEKSNNPQERSVLDYVITLLREEDLGKYYIRHTSDLNVAEMYIFLKNCVHFLQELGGYMIAKEYDEYMELCK